MEIKINVISVVWEGTAMHGLTHQEAFTGEWKEKVFHLLKFFVAQHEVTKFYAVSYEMPVSAITESKTYAEFIEKAPSVFGILKQEAAHHEFKFVCYDETCKEVTCTLYVRQF